ncbi:MAG TPA: glycosyl hydrolase 115 family protein [Longimicrobiales bacterium]|nr:glycosyl hydrolase 115 family protein [Longimicrobiales bacterium]
MAVVWAEDNYGHLCQVPTASEAARSGGNGVYYHSSYSGWHDLWVYRSDASVMFDRIVIETTAGAVGNGLVGPVESPNNIARGDAVQAAKIAALPAAITGPGSLR